MPRWPIIQRKRASPPVACDPSTKGWMNERIWRSWCIKIDKAFAKKNRNILLIVDNTSSHKQIVMSNVRLCFSAPERNKEITAPGSSSFASKYRAREGRFDLMRDDTVNHVNLYEGLCMARAA